MIDCYQFKNKKLTPSTVHAQDPIWTLIGERRIDKLTHRLAKTLKMTFGDLYTESRDWSLF